MIDGIAPAKKECCRPLIEINVHPRQSMRLTVTLQLSGLAAAKQ
jgi:hypothetical protein